MKTYGLTHEQLAMVSVVQREMGGEEPAARQPALAAAALLFFDPLIAASVGPAPRNENYGAGPNSTSTGVGVLTSVLNLSLPFAGWMRNTAILLVFWLAA
jgi:hypothetical protein